ncbi:MAG: ribose-phosphate pyrophosphokinase [Syntrophobacteraceae bacterium]|nr:ribose-phosphate pyrophosphokinase [Syntrophobacteraceae bacterium]
MQSRLVILCGNSNLPLAHKVCAHLGISPCPALVGRFSDGEVRVDIPENVRGRDVFILQSTCPPVNENLVELLVMMDALRRASAARINAVIPYYGYGRQDEKDKPRVSIAAKLIANLLSAAGADRLISVDLHSEQIEGFFGIPVDHVQGVQVLAEDLRGRLRGDEIVLAPDAGGVQRARRFAKLLTANLAIVDQRTEEKEPFARIVGQVRGKRVIIVDDMVDTGRVLLRAVHGAMAAGAASVEACCVHALLSGNAMEKIESSPLDLLTVTDTIPPAAWSTRSSKFRTVSMAPVLAEIIRRVHEGLSVSVMFPG